MHLKVATYKVNMKAKDKKIGRNLKYLWSKHELICLFGSSFSFSSQTHS